MRHLICLLAWAAVSASAQSIIEGKVEVPVAPRKAVTPARYQGKVQPGAPEPRVAVVYLEGTFPEISGTNRVVAMAQRNLQFAHSVMPVQKGTTVEFPNEDDEYHNVLSYSRAKNFDLGRYLKAEKPPSITFDKPGLVDLNCEIHEHMFANILVLETPYFTRSDTNGVFRLEKIPPGNYTLKAWLGPKTILSKPVEVKAGETVHVDFK